MAWHRGQAYGQDLRERVLTANGTIHEVAMRFAVSDSYVARVRCRYRQLGETRPGAQHNHMPLKLCGREQALLAKVKASPDMTLVQLCQWVKEEYGVSVGITTMHKMLKRLGLTLKKRHCMQPNKSEPMLLKPAKHGEMNKPAWT